MANFADKQHCGQGEEGVKIPKKIADVLYGSPQRRTGGERERLFTNEEERESASQRARPESDLIPSQSGEQSGAEVTLA